MRPAKVDVNTARQAQLDSLSRFGPALANRLLNARPFTVWADLPSRSKGVGPVTAQKRSDAGLRVQGLPYMSAATQTR